MSRSHNIVGCEASFAPPADRLRFFSHAHGSIHVLPRARRARVTLAFVAGVLATFLAAALLAAASR